MKVLCIDPGNVQTAYVILDEHCKILEMDLIPNVRMLKRIKELKKNGDVDHMAIEMIASMGMAVGATVFETVYWIGRFVQAWMPRKHTRVFRLEVKLHLCGQARAKDKNIRVALIDKYGGQPGALGLKKKPGPLYGIRKDMWSALAVGITWLETNEFSPKKAGRKSI